MLNNELCEAQIYWLTINGNFKAGVMENYKAVKTIKSCPDQLINKNSWQLTRMIRTVDKNNNSTVYSGGFGNIRMGVTKQGKCVWGERTLLRC